MLKQWSRARERCCMLISPPSACLPRSLLPPAPSSARRPPACGAPSFPAGPPPPASRSPAFPRVLPAAGEPHPGWPAERSPHGAPGTHVCCARLPGLPTGERVPEAQGHPRVEERARKSKARPRPTSPSPHNPPHPAPVPRPKLNLHHPTGFQPPCEPPRPARLSCWRGQAPQRLRAATLAPQHPARCATAL